MYRAVLKEPDFFFLLRTALQDRPKGPPTANRQLPSTANRHQPPTTNRQQPPATKRQPPTATNRQPPTAANRQRRPTANCQPLPTATNHQSPTTNRRQPPPTATNRQLPTANRQPLPTANRHQPWLSTWSARGLFWENWFRNTFFFPLRTAPAQVLARDNVKGRVCDNVTSAKEVAGQHKHHKGPLTKWGMSIGGEPNFFCSVFFAVAFWSFSCTFQGRTRTAFPVSAVGPHFSRFLSVKWWCAVCQ